MSIRKHSCSYGLNIPVSLDPASQSTSNTSINNNIIFQSDKEEKPLYPPAEEPPIYPSVAATPNYNNVQTRNINVNEDQTNDKRLEDILYEIYAKILLSENTELISNLVSKKHIILTKTNLELVIKTVAKSDCIVELYDTDGSCCVAKYSPIKKIEAIKLINDDLVSNFKFVKSELYYELQDKYHICLTHSLDD